MQEDREPDAPKNGFRPGFRSESSVRFGSAAYQQPQIAQVVAGGAGNHRIAQGGEERAGVELRQCLFRIKTKRARPGSRGGVGDGSGGAGIAVNAVGSSAEHRDGFPGETSQFQRAGKRELLVAATGARSAIHGDRHLASRYQAKTRMGST